jgi:membrane protease YdiL (CAAX protease family)
MTIRARGSGTQRRAGHPGAAVRLVAAGGTLLVLGPAQALAQSSDVTSMTVGDVWSRMTEWRMGVLAAAAAAGLLIAFASDSIRPGSLVRAGIRDVKPIAWPVWVFSGFVVYLMAQLAGQVAAAQPWLAAPDDPLRQAAMLSLAGQLAGVVAGLGMLSLASRTAPNAGLKLLGAPFLMGLGCFLLAAPLVFLSGDLARLMQEAIAQRPVEPLAHQSLDLIVQNRESPWAWVLIATAVVGAPIVEEIVFRGFLQSALLRLTGSPWAAISLASFLFVGVHALPGADGEPVVPYFALVPLLVLSVSMGIAFERTKRLAVPLAMHVAFNAVNVTLALTMRVT